MGIISREKLKILNFCYIEDGDTILLFTVLYGYYFTREIKNIEGSNVLIFKILVYNHSLSMRICYIEDVVLYGYYFTREIKKT
jgi:hypothetical protein